MEIQQSRNVRIVCDLNVGDIVRTDGWGYQLDNKDWVIQEIKRSDNCHSGFLVKINGYRDFIDSSWLIKVK